jgi:putative ABC transport system permease protein
VVISESAWRRYFSADPAILGTTIRLKTLGPEAGFLDGTPLTVAGVMPQRFDFPAPYTDFWVPITEDSPARTRLAGGVIARLRDDTSVAVAIDEANAIGEGLRPTQPSGPSLQPLPPGVQRFVVERLKEQTVASTRPALQVLAIAVGLVLLIVCANVTNLLLARGTARQREMAVRTALGAGRGRLIRQLLTESAVLAGAGGLLGAALAAGGVVLLRELGSPDAPGPFQISFGGAMLPRLHEIAVDARILTFATALAAMTTFLIGVTPAVSLSRGMHGEVMRQRVADGGGAPGGRTRLLDTLVVGQLAIATMLLVGAGLLLNSFSRLTRVDPGWDASGVLTFYLVMPQDYATARKAGLIEELISELRRLPGVQRAGFTYAGPLLALIDYVGVFVPPGRTLEEMRENPVNPQFRAVSHDYLQTMGARLLAGRWFQPQDDAGAPPVIVVSRSVVQQLFGGQYPVGQFVHLDGRLDLPPQEIIGVVDDMRQARIEREPAPQMFMDYRQVLAFAQAREMPTAAQERLAFGFLSFAVRTDGDPAPLIPAVRRLVGRVDPAAGIDAILPMERLVASSLTRQRFYAVLLAVFAGIAVTIAAIGIYGVFSFAVARRTQEIGIRIALGARHAEVLRLVMHRGMVLIAAGMSLGLAGAVVLSGFLDGMLYDLTPLDPATYATVALLFAAVAAVATYLPARRATRVDPMVALRYE